MTQFYSKTCERSISIKTLAFLHSNDRPFAVGDCYPVLSGFSHHELANTVSPFLLLEHLRPGALKPTQLSKGVREHSHRGFEKVFIMFQGEWEHRDSNRPFLTANLLKEVMPDLV